MMKNTGKCHVADAIAAKHLSAKEATMPLKSKPIYIWRPDLETCCGASFIPYYYKEEIK